MEKQLIRMMIEGTDYANTKGIACALRESPRLVDSSGYRPYTSVISTKWGNFNNFPWGKNLVRFVSAEEDQAFKNYGIWLRLIEVQKYYGWILDRFHISTQQYQMQFHNHRCDFVWLEERLLKLGFYLVLVTQDEEALVRAMNQNRNHKDNDIEQAVRAQEWLREFSSSSILPNLELNISKMSFQETIDSMIDWYGEVSLSAQVDDPQSDKLFLPSCS